MNQKHQAAGCTVLAVMAFALSACGSNSKATALAYPSAMRPAGAVTEAPAVERLPHADRTVSLERYARVDRPDQIAALYYAVSNLPVDYQEMAALTSQEYRATVDEFRKRELMQALHPAIDNAVTAFRSNRYVSIPVGGVVLEHFNFPSHAFPLRAPWDEESSFVYFGWTPKYSLSFSNGAAFSRFTVEDEAAARPIEERVSRFDAVHTAQAYLFAQAVDMNANRVKCEIVHVSLIDRKNNVIGELASASQTAEDRGEEK